MTKDRGKRKDNGEEVKGYYFHAAHKDAIGNITSRHYILSDEAGIVSCHTSTAIFSTKEYVDDFIEVIPESVAQYTTINDKNDVEIYGSIEISGKMSKGGDKIKETDGSIRIIVFDQARACFRAEDEVAFSDFISDSCEVIGRQYNDKGS